MRIQLRKQTAATKYPYRTIVVNLLKFSVSLITCPASLIRINVTGDDILELYVFRVCGVMGVAGWDCPQFVSVSFWGKSSSVEHITFVMLGASHITKAISSNGTTVLALHSAIAIRNSQAYRATKMSALVPCAYKVAKKFFKFSHKTSLVELRII